MFILAKYIPKFFVCLCLLTIFLPSLSGGESEKFNCQWTVSFDNDSTIEKARLYSQPGNTLPKSRIFTMTNNMVDLSKYCSGFVPGKSKSMVRGVFRSPESGKMIIGVGADWWFHGFINGKPFGDTGKTGNHAYPVGPMDQIYVVDLKKGENVISFHLQSGRSWLFGVTMLSVPQDWPADYRIIKHLAETMLADKFRMMHEPLVFDLSSDKAKIMVEFSLPALCGIRLTPADGGKAVTRWYTICGQREHRQIHLFSFDGLTANTTYNYEILHHNEKEGRESVIYSGKFTTFPTAATEHRFFVFSDVQVQSADKRQAIMDFVRNTLVKQADFIVALGDMASGFGDFSKEYFTDFTDLLRNNGARQPLTFVRGNHELTGKESSLYSQFLGRPYGAFVYGDTFYIRLDCGESNPPRMSPFSKTQRTNTAEYFAGEAAWLAAVVASPECRNARRRIVLAHATPFEGNNRYMARNLFNMVGKLFYGKNPLCKIDLWIAGHIHYSMRFDPVAGTLYGALPKGKKIPLTENDIKNIHFPVYTNDGPGAGIDLSVLDVNCRKSDILIRCVLPDGKIVDEVVITPGKTIKVKKTEFNLLWKK